MSKKDFIRNDIIPEELQKETRHQHKVFIDNIDERLSVVCDDIALKVPIVDDFKNDLEKFQKLMDDTLSYAAGQQFSQALKNLVKVYIQDIDDLDEDLLNDIDDQAKEVRDYNRLSKLVSKINNNYDFALLKKDGSND